MSTASSTPWEPIRSIKAGSMGEMPPKTMGISGFSWRMARLAAITISANIFQSGSTLKSQWERLFGSFHSITASTISLHPWTKPGRPTVCPQARAPKCVCRLFECLQEYRPRSPLRMVHDLQPGTAQHGLHGAVIGNPPVRGITGILLLNEVHAGKIQIVEDLFVPEVVVLFQRGTIQGTADHRLENQFASYLLDDFVQRVKRITQMIENTHEQDVVKLARNAVCIIDGTLFKFDVQTQHAGRKAGLIEIAVVHIHGQHAAGPASLHLNGVEAPIATQV